MFLDDGFRWLRSFEISKQLQMIADGFQSVAMKMMFLSFDVGDFKLLTFATPSRMASGPTPETSHSPNFRNAVDFGS